MNHLYRTVLAACLFFPFIAFSQTISFTAGNLAGESLTSPTSLQFGPDGRLYVSQQNGIIYAYTVVRNGANDYQVTASEAIALIQQITNHNDDGTVASTTNTRQVTGIVVAGTSTNPIIYVTSSDPRIGGGGGATNKNLDTNSGIISRLSWSGSSWIKTDLVRGLPRSEENHSPNGMAYDADENVLYMAQGGNTNMGAPSNNFVFLPEYALSTAILKIDLDLISGTYDLPTLDDETRTNVNATFGYTDQYDPFGGNNGKNQAMLPVSGPVSIYSPGWRNNYDVVITQAGRMYSFDNGPNAGWGGAPTNCSNGVVEPGIADCDVLHYVTLGYYAGHANPTRGSRNNKFNTSNPQSPIPAGLENPVECTYQTPDNQPQALTSICSSSNGMCEYKASNFSNAMKGDLLIAAFNGKINRAKLNAAGTAIVSGGLTALASNFGATPLDVIAQGDNDIFPGTIWAVTYGAGNITIFEPVDFSSCIGDPNSMTVDSDNDGFKNGDETANGTDPCSAASKPSDADIDNISDLTDPDDDNDGISDLLDRFALDPLNGFSTTIPVRYDFDNALDGGINNWGFTGLMTNGGIDYQQLYDSDKMTVGGAALKFTIEEVSSGDAFQTLNSQEYGYQFGVNSGASQWSYIVHSRVMGPFAGFTPASNQSMGMFIGTGDENNYLKIVTHANGGSGGIQVLKEENGATTANIYNASILNKSYVDLFLKINKNTNQVQASYSIEDGAQVFIGSPVNVPANWLSGVLAVGFISTSRGASAFPATWDFIEVDYDPSSVVGQWYQVLSQNSPTARHECGFVQAGDKFYLLGGRGNKPVQAYDIQDSVWSTLANNPLELHHFQPVEYNGLIYVIGAFTGSYPNETPVPNIYIYDPVANQWTVGPSIPTLRRRGSAGVVLHNNKFYIVCGIEVGHSSGWVKWVDRFDPQTNTWTQLADAPIQRDHFNATVANGKIYNIGGRRTNWGGDVFGPTVAQVDVYDIATNAWITLPAASNIPTPRAACATGLVGDEILAIGGESGSQATAHNETEAFHIYNHTWRPLADLLQGRHATSAIVSNGGVFVCAGSGNRGGSPELGTMEAFYFFDPTPPDGNQIVKGNLISNTIERFFGPVQVNATSTKSVTLANTGGTQVIMIDSIKLSSSQHFSFNFPNSFPTLLGVNQSLTFNVSFRPTSTGIKNATLQIFHNGKNATVSIALKGDGNNQTCTSNCVSKIWYADGDGDGFGYPYDSIITTLTPTNFVLNNDDCNDAVAAINPSATELLDSLDNNCNTAIDEGFGSPKILFVVGNLVLSVSDAALKTRMEQLGFEVTVVNDAAVTETQANGKNVIFLSSTATSGNIGNKFTNTPVALINCEYQLYDDLKMCPSGTANQGSVYTQTQLSITGSGHPLAAGLPNGTTTIMSSTDRLVWGVPNANAAKIATVVSNSNQTVLFGYEAGAAMSGMTAPAKRVGFFIFDTAGDNLNANGLALLDAALLWCGQSNPTPQVSITLPTAGSSFTTPANVNVAASATIFTGTINKVEFYLNGNLFQTDFDAPYNLTLTNVALGNYSVHAKAFSNLGVSSTSATINFSVQNSPAPGSGALLVVGSTSLNSGDLAVKNRLESLGFTVTVKSASSSTTADAQNKALVFVSATVNSGDVLAKFTNVTVPVILCEQALFDDMKMTNTASGNAGTISGANSIVITNNAHPLAAGLQATTTQIYSSNDKLTFGKPASSAFSIASVPGNNTQIVVFGYETGAAMFSLNAPARRVGFFLNDISASMLTAQGFQLLDAAILWAAPAALEPDCNGDLGGSAHLNACNICVGGNTGLTEYEGTDCNNDCGGSAYFNSCGICVSGNTGVAINAGLDCTGNCGSAITNECGVCVGGNTGLPLNQGKDCNGVCNGTATLDNCNVCSGGNTGHVANSDKDACGICFGQNISCCQNDTECNDNSACTIDACVQNTCAYQQISGSPYLKVVNTQKSWKKLKFGYDPGSLFSPKQNVSSGGNNQLCITLRDPLGTAEWNKIQIRPSGSSSAQVTLSNHVPAQPGTDWFTICIPMSAFNSFNFTQLSFMELPYSNGADAFEIHIKNIKFIGGSSPFLWFGDAKTDNYHDGNTGSSLITALIAGAPCNTGNTPDCAGVLNGTAFLNSCGICVGGSTGLSPNHGKDCNGVCNGSATLDNCNVCSGGNTGHVANSDIDNCGVCFGNGSSCAPPPVCVPLQVVSFTLMQTGTAGEIGPFTEGSVINLATTNNFNLRANVCPGSTAVKSVKFILNGATVRTESTAPFAIAGDSPAENYQKWNISPGSYTLTVNPYSGTGGTGTLGIPHTVHFTVVQSAKTTLPAANAEDENVLLLYPNPNNGEFNLELDIAEKADVTLKIFNHLGQVVRYENNPQYEGEYKNNIRLQEQPAGMYFIQLQYGEKLYNEKVIVRH